MASDFSVIVSQVEENKYVVRWNSAEIVVYRKGEAVHLKIEAFPMHTHTTEEYMEFMVFQRKAVEIAVKLHLGEKIDCTKSTIK